ncbi:MAG: Uma2 family endonuclease [Bernardetiaceae bacterium]|nr:Uma2 family endonuclease [Bernardetiaceae bacterium]
MQIQHTFEDYLRYDRSNLLKSEYRKGNIYAMPGGTFKHSLLTSRLANAFYNSCADAQGCLIASPDMRLYIPNCQLSAYPDMMVVCDKPEFYEGKKDVLLNPRIVAEVLSKSTEMYDRQTKMPCYFTIPTTDFVLMIAQDHQEIEVYRRSTNWQKESYLEGDIQIDGCTINVDFVYKNTDF